LLDEHAAEFQESVRRHSDSVGGYVEKTAQRAVDQIEDAQTNAFMIKNVIRDASDCVMLDYVNKYSGKPGFPFFQSVRRDLLWDHEVWLELDSSCCSLNKDYRDCDGVDPSRNISEHALCAWNSTNVSYCEMGSR
jgi:hypothetical protein